mmetsp:Transcript_65834/g.177225  ORF Transcript_65834/g.177225 Transcript_65834/m.177225 type:complete len:210 (-) Transcript_65834:646-1275(-)
MRFTAARRHRVRHWEKEGPLRKWLTVHRDPRRSEEHRRSPPGVPKALHCRSRAKARQALGSERRARGRAGDGQTRARGLSAGGEACGRTGHEEGAKEVAVCGAGALVPTLLSVLRKTPSNADEGLDGAIGGGTQRICPPKERRADPSVQRKGDPRGLQHVGPLTRHQAVDIPVVPQLRRCHALGPVTLTCRHAEDTGANSHETRSSTFS